MAQYQCTWSRNRKTLFTLYLRVWLDLMAQYQCMWSRSRKTLFTLYLRVWLDPMAQYQCMWSRNQCTLLRQTPLSASSSSPATILGAHSRWTWCKPTKYKWKSQPETQCYILIISSFLQHHDTLNGKIITEAEILLLLAVSDFSVK